MSRRSQGEQDQAAELVRRQVKRVSQFRKFLKQRTFRRRNGLAQEAASVRGLATLGHDVHSYASQDQELHKLLQRVLLSELPMAYHTRLGQNALHAAAASGNLASVRSIIEAGTLTSTKRKAAAAFINPAAKDHNGWTALHYSAASSLQDSCEVLQTLLDQLEPDVHDHDALFRQRDKFGCNVAAVALSRGNLQQFAFILDHCRNPEILLRQSKGDRDGRPIFCSALYNAGLEAVNACRRYLAVSELQAPDPQGRSPMHYQPWLGALARGGHSKSSSRPSLR